MIESRDESGHDQAPEDPKDGDTFTCSRCGAQFTFVDLADGLAGEWVSE